VKIGKVQSARRRHWRDVKENERAVEAKEKLRRAEVENRERERERERERKRERDKERERSGREKAWMREAAGDIVSAA